MPSPEIQQLNKDLGKVEQLLNEKLRHLTDVVGRVDARLGKEERLTERAEGAKGKVALSTLRLVLGISVSLWTLLGAGLAYFIDQRVKELQAPETTVEMVDNLQSWQKKFDKRFDSFQQSTVLRLDVIQSRHMKMEAERQKGVYEDFGLR